MTNLQEKLLEILDWFHKLCKKENLRYYVIGGTFIGAVRHKGFIPWDDDVDVAMPRSDYEKVIGIFRKNKNNMIGKYLLETISSDAPDFFYTFGKLYDTTTTMTEKLRRECKRGVYLDIFPLDGVGNSLQESKKYFSKIDRLNMFLMARICAIENRRKWYKNIAIIAARLIPELIVDDKKIARKVDRLCKKKDFDSCKYVCNCSSTYRSKEIIERRLLGTPKEYVFENITVMGPELYDEYLTHIFGNWRKLPPVEKRIPHHDFIEVDLNKSYLRN